jgi:serine/threonine-protein kinase RsbW
MIESPNVRMALVSRPENIVLVRDVLSGLGDGLDLGGTVEDIKAAVSEAANNVVIHAYAGGAGPMEVEIAIAGRNLDVVVRDHGVGIGPRAVDERHPGRGIGLAVIEALAARCELRAHGSGTGVEVAMRFDVPAQPELPGLGADDRRVAGIVLDDADALEISIGPASLSAPVFDRVVTGLAARAGFSIDRLSDVQLVVDALTARIVPALAADHVRLGAVTRGRAIELTVAPLRAGGSLALVADTAVAELPPVIERLADEVAMRSEDAGEVLALVLRDRRPERSARPAPAGAS